MNWTQKDELIQGCEQLAQLIKYAEVPESIVRRILTFELAEFVYNGHCFWERWD